MKIFQVGVIFIFLVSSAVSAKQAELIEMESGFDPTGVISVVDTIKTEVGVRNGVAYTASLKTGSAIFEGEKGGSLKLNEGNWRVICLSDPFTGIKSCALVRGNLMVMTDSETGLRVSVGKSHFPGSNVTIMIDSNKPIIGGEKFRFTQEQIKLILSQLNSGKKVSTRFKKWPYEHNVDEEYSLYGFNEAVEYMNWVVKKIK